MSVSIVMPCYNEERIIERAIRDYYNTVIARIDDSEFIVIDDRSSDNTHNILEELAVEFPELKVLRTPVNSGHGKAIRMGYEFATKDYVFQVDSDDQFEAGDFWKLYPFKDSYDLILGFREKRDGPMPRVVLMKIICLMNFIIFGGWIKDANCPFRLIKKEVLDKILKLVDKEAVAPNIMISILAKRKRIKTREVPVSHRKRAKAAPVTMWKISELALKGFIQLLRLKRL